MVVKKERLEYWETVIKESVLRYIINKGVGAEAGEKPCALFKKMLEEFGITVEE